MAEHDETTRTATLADIMRLLVLVYGMGIASGKSSAYGDCLHWTGGKLAEAEAAMAREPHSAFAMSECMVWAAFRDHYHGADTWNQRKLLARSGKLVDMADETNIFTRQDLMILVEELAVGPPKR